MNTSKKAGAPAASLVLPGKHGLYYGGAWHAPVRNGSATIASPATGKKLADIAVATVEDVELAIAAAHQGFVTWRDVLPQERARILREVAAIIRRHADELAMLDAADSGNPYREMTMDMEGAAAHVEFFAGLVTEMKGDTIPSGPDSINLTLREPLGVVARILPFNHPLMFCAAKSAAILAAGNAVIIKPPEQAPLSSLRFAELVGHLFPPGVLNVLPGDRVMAASLAGHARIAKVALVGSVPAGRAVLRSAADTVKPALLELGGKNALLAFPDADPAAVARAAVRGMNFGWCGQSCGSTSRAFIHEDFYDDVIGRMREEVKAFVPGLPTDPATTMGAIVSAEQHAKVLRYIRSARDEGARLLCGGGPPASPELANGYFVEPTIFVDVKPEMTIAREEIFGPVLSVFRWRDPKWLIETVNGTEYGLTCSIWTRDLITAHRTARQVEAGFVWINEVSRHFIGSPFGGYKQSGMGREECLAELLAFTQEKHIHVRL